MKSRLCGHAEIYKPYLDRDLLCDEFTGVTYFKDTLRPHFIKGAEHTFLWRYLTFMQKSHRRSGVELLEWIARYEISLKRLKEAWRDLLPPDTAADLRYRADVQDANAAPNPGINGFANPDDPLVFQQWYDRSQKA